MQSRFKSKQIAKGARNEVETMPTMEERELRFNEKKVREDTEKRNGEKTRSEIENSLKLAIEDNLSDSEALLLLRDEEENGAKSREVEIIVSDVKEEEQDSEDDSDVNLMKYLTTELEASDEEEVASESEYNETTSSSEASRNSENNSVEDLDNDVEKIVV
jgi:hypothetical protein